MAQEQIIRICTNFKEKSYLPQLLAQNNETKPEDIGNQTRDQGSDESMLLVKSKQVFQNYEEAKLKLKKATDYLQDNRINTMSGDLQYVVDYQNRKLKLLAGFQKEANELYSTINKFLIGKKAILMFFSGDVKDFGDEKIKKIKQDIMDFEDILKKLALLTTSA